MTSSRLIRAEGAADAVVSWRVPDMSLMVAAPKAAEPEEDLDALRARARAEGFAEGRAEGRAEGLRAAAQELAEQRAALERALDVLARPLEDAGHRVEEEILALVQTVARQLLRREMHLDPTHLVGVIREGLAALPLATDTVTVRLHPADAEVVQGCLKDTGGERAWRIETDPLLERGGCLITTPRSVVDARLDTRLARVMAALAGDERHDHG
jgi:flagellar assembly protein FliH